MVASRRRSGRVAKAEKERKEREAGGEEVGEERRGAGEAQKKGKKKKKKGKASGKAEVKAAEEAEEEEEEEDKAMEDAAPPRNEREQPDAARKAATAKSRMTLERLNKLQDKTRGMPKSGRAWKLQKRERSSAYKVKNKSTRLSYDRRMERKREQAAMRQREKEMKEAEREERALAAERRRTKKRIKEENEKKSSVVQEIKDIGKIKRMGKKQLRYIMTMDTVKAAAKHKKMYAAP